MFRCMPFLACNRQVDSLDKRQCNLQSIPNEVDRYARSLEELLLDMNHIKELSKSLFRLHKLKRLDLSDNDIYRLPPDISNLQSLIELNLGRNDISDIPENLKFCKQLMYLDLSSNPITRLPATITQLRSLTSLGLNDVSLTQLPQDIGQLSNLKSLEVRENLIRTLPQSIAFLSHLQRLDLGQNELDELPVEIGRLSSLVELYVDSNDLDSLPLELSHCQALQQLDVSENKLSSLFDELGELIMLTDLVLSQNCIQILPHSIGRLKKLTILKLDKNTLTSLTPAIGSCAALQELFITENLLTELPSSIGNLKQLKNLNLDKNQFTELPTTIGSCSSLGVLTIRDNLLEQLPMEVGKLEQLTVLDVCNNRLSYLPFTINVLYNLQAMWLSENQSQAMLKLQTDQDPRTGIKVLTCYLLPQQSAIGAQDPTRHLNRSIVGGPKVHFTDMESSQDEEHLPLGTFERHDTPHPKPHGNKSRKHGIDGHVIQHDTDPVLQPGSNAHPESIALPTTAERRKSLDLEPKSVEKPTPAPRSALRHPSFVDEQMKENEKRQGPVLFTEDTEETGPSKLKRKNTPHYSKGTDKHVPRPIDTNTHSDRPPMSLQSEQHHVVIRRDHSGGLGLSIAGGLGSTPYRGDDPGLFVSRLADDGPADQVGLKIGDKLVRVNGMDVGNVDHVFAVQAMQDGRKVVELTVERDVLKLTPIALNHSFNDDQKETISTSFRRDPNGSPGFSVAGGKGAVPFKIGDESVFISAVSKGGSAERDGKLKIGDRVVSINGVNMKGARHDQAVSLLTGHIDNEVYLVVQREPTTALLSPAPKLPSTPLSKLPSIAPLATSSPNSTLQSTKKPTSWDGLTEDVILVKEDRLSLGLSIVGGSDHSSHPFGINQPGVFISKITTDSPAQKCARLRVGDRILSVDGRDLSKSAHHEAVQALKAAGKTVRLTVVHEKQPIGLREVKIKKRTAKEPLGINICGGINSPSANPLDRTDEGIFIEKVQTEGAAARSASLEMGMRLLEVNDESLLGCTQDEAASILRQAGLQVALLVCDGFDHRLFPIRSPQLPKDHAEYGSISAGMDTSAIVLSVSKSSKSAGNIVLENPMLEDEPKSVPPMINEDSSVILPNKTQSASSIPKSVTKPPPIAPKPHLKKQSNGDLSAPIADPEDYDEDPIKLSRRPAAEKHGIPSETHSFTSKVKQFEHVIEVKKPPSLPSKLPKPSIPPKRTTPTAKENETERHSVSPLKNSNIPSPTGGPMVVRTLKAQNRMNAINENHNDDDERPLNSVEKRAKEARERAEWRQARMKSLEADALQAEKMMEQVRQLNDTTHSVRYPHISSNCPIGFAQNLANISEETSTTTDEQILQNEISMERFESIDPITGAKTVSIVQKSVTQKQTDMSLENCPLPTVYCESELRTNSR